MAMVIVCVAGTGSVRVLHSHQPSHGLTVFQTRSGLGLLKTLLYK